mgnify:CR=1 FL=1
MAKLYDKKVDRWFQRLEHIWRSRNIEGIPELMAPRFEYYEDPHDQPLTSISQLVEVWSEVRNQDLQHLQITPVSSFRGTGAALWECIIGKGKEASHLRGAYLVELDAKGRCTLFRQWWVAKE